MRNNLLFFLLFVPFVLLAQLRLSTEIPQLGFSHALDVKAWGDQYIIRVSAQSVLPFDYVDYLLFANEEGVEYNSNSFNPYDQVSSDTQTDVTVLKDGSAVALATDLDGDSGGRPRLTHFNDNGDTLMTRYLSDFSTFGYSLCSADTVIFVVGRGDGDGLETFTVRSVNLEFEDVYTLKFLNTGGADYRFMFNTIYAEPGGRLHIAYERRREIPPFVSDSEFFVVTVSPEGLLLNERSVGSPIEDSGFEKDYTVILPVGEEGIALLDGLNEPESFCAGFSCTSVKGNLRIYRDATSPAEVYKLEFSPFGMELLPDGDLFVYGATYIFGNSGHGVLFKPTGWPDGNRIHLIKDPFTAELGAETYSRIYGMDVAENGDLVGIGEVGYGGSLPDDREFNNWLFRIGPNGCFTEDCSDLAEDPGDLVPVTNLEHDISIKSFPNPFTNQVTFAPLNYATGEFITVSLHDITGRLLRNSELGSGLEWATDQLAAGVYLATFTRGTQSKTVKLIKQ